VIDWRCVAAAVDVPTNGRHLPGGVIDWRRVAAGVDVPTTVGTYRGRDRLAVRGCGGGCADQRSAPTGGRRLCLG